MILISWPVSWQKSMDHQSIISNLEKSSPRRVTIMRVQSTGSIQPCQNIPLVKHTNQGKVIKKEYDWSSIECLLIK